jgi:polysaccharide chain length determinant protein (PEP-CTERM system associated)
VLELIRVWRRRKWLAIHLFALPFTAATSFVAFMPNTYQSTATVLVERQQVPEAFVRPTVTGELETRLRTISQETLSRSRLESLIDKFGLYADVKTSLPPEAVINRMRSDIRLDLKGADPRGRGSTVAFSINYRGHDPETVAQVTNALASFYIEENLKVRERQATGTAKFLEVQLEEARTRLDEQERRVSEFKKRHVGELPEQMAANLAAVEQLNVQLRLNSVSRMRLEEKRELLAMQMPDAISSPPSVVAAPTAVTEEPVSDAARLIGLKRHFDELSSRLTDAHPRIIQKQAEIAALEQRIRREAEDAKAGASKTDASSPAVLSLQATRIKQMLGETEAEIKVLQNEDARLRKALAVHEQRVANTPRREQEFQELSRDYRSTKELYESLLKRHDEAQMAASMELRQKGEQFRILDPALASALPAAPNRRRLIIVAFLFSVGLAVGVVAVAEQLNTSFHTVDALSRFTSVPVLVSIPRMVADVDRRLRRRLRLAAVGTVLALVFIVGISYLFAHGRDALLRW